VFVTEPIDRGDPESGFHCGEPPLDAFFAKHALPNDRRGLGRTFVLRRGRSEQDDLPPILGFYTLSMADLAATRVPAELRPGLPRYPVPVALVGRLAVDSRAQGRGVGQRLLGDAILRVVEASRLVACLGVIVDAKNPRAGDFYRRYGFLVLEPEAPFPRRMFLSLGTVLAAMP